VSANSNLQLRFTNNDFLTKVTDEKIKKLLSCTLVNYHLILRPNW